MADKIGMMKNMEVLSLIKVLRKIGNEKFFSLGDGKSRINLLL